MDEKIKVLVVDDHLMVRMGLSIMLDELEDIIRVGEAETGEAALRQVDQLMPDVVLLDVRMPDMNGVETAKKILAKHPQMKILLMTAFSERDLILDALKHGILGVIEKNITLEDLSLALNMTSRGLSWLSKPFLKILLENSTSTPGTPAEQHELSPREMEIARMLVKGLSNPQIAGQLGINVNSVKKYLSIIYARLGVSNRSEAAVLLSQSGWLNQDEGQE